MTTPTSAATPPSTTASADAALELARLVIKAHSAAGPDEVARDLLALLRATTGATSGVLALARPASGAEDGRLRILATHDEDPWRDPTLAAASQKDAARPVPPGERSWERMTIPLVEPEGSLDGAARREAASLLVLLRWSDESGDAQRAHAKDALLVLRDPITAVVVSLLAAERERARGAVARSDDHPNAELLGTVSHELRSPLAAIKGYASTLLRHERKLSREERHEFLIAIDEASDRLEGIVNRLLEMSRLELGEAELDRFAMDIVPVVRDAIVDANARAAPQTRRPPRIALVTLDADGRPAELEPLIFADPRATREVIHHLLENAIKYSPQAGEITVTLRPARAGNAAESDAGAPAAARAERFLEITVRDQGMGIPGEHLGRIFERFHRVDTRLTREVDGLGLGLAICQRLVKLHGGAIWAESQPGEGSVFHVLLPVVA